MQKFNRIRQVAPMCPHGRTRCRHLSNNVEPSIYGGNATYVKLLSPLVIFGHAHLDRRIDGGTENARPENMAQSKLQDWKTQDWKTRHQTAGEKRHVWKAKLAITLTHMNGFFLYFLAEMLPIK